MVLVLLEVRPWLLSLCLDGCPLAEEFPLC